MTDTTTTKLADFFKAIARALWRGFLSFWHPKVLLLLIWPPIVAVLLWGGIAWLSWDPATIWLRDSLQQVAQEMGLQHPYVVKAVQYASYLFVTLLLAPAVIMTVVFLVAIFGMPVVVAAVSPRFYPTLVMHRGGTFLGSLRNVGQAVLTFLVLWLLTLPMWLGLLVLAGPLAFLVPLLNSAYLNQRVFRYDALTEHASAEELRLIFPLIRPKLIGLGVLMGVLMMIPVVHFLIPLYAATCYTHLCLGELEKYRAARASPASLPPLSFDKE